MTTILPENFTCPECGHAFEVFILHSHNNFGNEEPFFIDRGYAWCPECGHKTEMDGAIEFLSEDPEERMLQLDPLFEPTPEREKLPPGVTEVTFGKFIRPAKDTGEPGGDSDPG